MKKYSSFLDANGIRPSLQRIAIYEFIYNNRVHPTVDVVYESLASSIPTLSKTTVYNTLKLFVEKGIAVTVNIEDNEVRYDANTTVHGHFKCTSCDGVFDFAIDQEKLSFLKIEDFHVTEFHLNLKGLCKVCNT